MTLHKTCFKAACAAAALCIQRKSTHSLEALGSATKQIHYDIVMGDLGLTGKKAGLRRAEKRIGVAAQVRSGGRRLGLGGEHGGDDVRASVGRHVRGRQRGREAPQPRGNLRRARQREALRAGAANGLHRCRFLTAALLRGQLAHHMHHWYITRSSLIAWFDMILENQGVWQCGAMRVMPFIAPDLFSSPL